MAKGIKSFKRGRKAPAGMGSNRKSMRQMGGSLGSRRAKRGMRGGW